MNVWIITTGSSDVQLKNKDRWNALHSKARSQLGTSKQFSFIESEQSGKKLWRYPSRAMGIVYGQALAEHYKDLEFPLVNSFSGYLKKEQIELNRIIVLLTDQSDVVSAANKDKPSHPYWQDTCTLKPILEHYLNIAFADVVMDSDRDFIVLKPNSGSAGLDDWNEVLNLVQQEFIKLDIPEDATVYVSHQAGTPAISSAVQFSSLARFRTNVQFLVSNEYSQETRPISRSNYLGAIQLQEAKALLERHDYAGVKLLVNDYLDSETKILLDAAIQCNLAKFDEFASEIQKLSDKTFLEQVNKRSQQWWWTAYEAAYLAGIRHEQKNIVEALFHSFRSVEGLVCQWAEEKYKDYIFYDKKGSPQITEKIQEILPEYWKKMKEKNSGWIEQQNKENENRQGKSKEPKSISVGLFSQNLYSLLEYVRPDCKQDPSLKKGLYSAKDERNQQFHRLLGLREEDLFKAWKADDIDAWKSILLGCLNFIAKEDLTEEFTSLEEASLMAKVHKELDLRLNGAIAQSEHTP